MVRRRRIAGIALVPLAAALAIPAVAWACSVQTELDLGVAYGAARSQTTVRGTAFAPGDVQLHWNSVSGPVLATTSGPAFSTTVTIPDAPPATYYVVAVQSGSDGLVTRAAAAFDVTGPGSSAAGPWATGTGSRSAGLLEPESSSAGGISPVTAGVVFLGAGLVLMGAGFSYAELRRRRVVASTVPSGTARLR